MKKQKQLDKWWRHGLLKAGGWHPLNARIRARIPDENIEADYEWEYSSANLKRLKELGINVIVSQFDRGLGESDQAKHQKLAKKLAAMCHKHGIRHGVYIANTIYYESMLKDHPECGDWTVKTSSGKKTYYGGEQTWRWVACLNSPDWRARQKRIIEKAILYVKTDLLHFDNLCASLCPDDCHCDHCLAGFKNFLIDKYPDKKAQLRRFGFTGFDTFKIPVFWDHFSLPWHLQRISSPLLQEWLLFRDFSTTSYIRELTDYARKLNPGICCDSNGQGIHGNNTGLSQGRGDHENQIACVDIMCEENPDLRLDNDPGAIYPAANKFRSMIFARNLEKSFFTAYGNEEELAFNITFSGDCGINTHWGYAEPGKAALNAPQPGVMELIRHYRRNLNLYTSCAPAARTAVWRGYKSLLFVSTDTHLSACVMEYTLFENRIPFTIIPDGFIKPAKLKKFDLLILPNVEFISDEQARIISDYVRNGGNLMITEYSGIYTDEPRKRKQHPFARLFHGSIDASRMDQPENAVIDEAKQFGMCLETGAHACARHGRGRVAYIPEILYVYPPLTFKSGYNVNYDGIDSRYWKQPYNSYEIISAMEWLNPALYPVHAHGCNELRMEYLRAENGATLASMVRLGELNGPRDIPFSMTTKTAPRNSLLHSPESDKPVSLVWNKVGEKYETILKNVYRHAVVSFEKLTSG